MRIFAVSIATGKNTSAAGLTAPFGLQVQSGIVVGSERCQRIGPLIFTSLAIDLNRKRLSISKLARYLSRAFAAIAGEVIYMASPGSIAPDPKLNPYRRLDHSRPCPWADVPLAALNLESIPWVR